jgi:hypothetical protein
MRLAPHVSSPGRDRPARSALRFSQAGLQRNNRYSARSLLAVQHHEGFAMPFRSKGPAGLTKRLDVRVSPGEKDQIRTIASDAGMRVAELVRLRALRRPVVPRTDATTVRELRRLGGLLSGSGTYMWSRQALDDFLAGLPAGGAIIRRERPGAPLSTTGGTHGNEMDQKMELVG